MPAILAFFRVFLSSAVLVPLVQRLAAAIGIAAVSYAGFHVLLNAVVAHIQTQVGALPANVLAILAVANVWKAISVVLSALTTRMVVKGVTESGMLKRITWSGGNPIVLN